MNGPSGPEDLMGGGGSPQGQLLMPSPNLPQPPQQQGGGPIPGGTLGDVNQQMAPGNPLVDQYVQIAQALEQQLAPLKMRVQPPQPGPGLLQSLATFGMANLKHVADENTRREENYVAIKNNQALSLKAAAMAQHMVDAQAAQGAIQSRMQLAQQRYITDLQDKTLAEYHRQLTDAYRGTMPRPKSPMEARMQGDTEESTQFPGRLVPKAGGGWEPPAAGSPMDTALGGVAGRSAPAATTDAGPRPGESRADWAERKANEAKMAVPTTSSRTMSEMAPKVLDFVSTIEQELKGITGPVASRWREFKAGKLGLPDRAFAQYRTDVGLLQSALMRMHAGSRGSEVLVKKFTDLLNSGIQSPENMQGALDSIKKYATDVQQQGGAATSSTPGSTTPPSTGASTQPTGATGVTPGGVKFRVVQ